ncbi:MAG: UvrD-helicase domain-containing protein [bacterium]
MMERRVEILRELNPEQAEAVTTGGYPLLVRAGAGSGKTRVITYRIAYLIGCCGVKPWNILGLTFTNKAADEMKERVIRLVGNEAEGVMIRTFHSFCTYILRREADRAGFKPGFSIYDEPEQREVIKHCLTEMNIQSTAADLEIIQNSISMAKNFCRTPGDFFPGNHPLTDRIQAIYEKYERKLVENNALDFDNLILKVIELFQKERDILEKYRRRFPYILVDEYQDTNHAQFVLLQLLAGRCGNLMAVGDHDQAIYGWRGADITNILTFEKKFDSVRIVELGQNYRSTQCILDAANSLIRFNTGSSGKKLWTTRGQGEKVRYYASMNERDEVDFVLDEVERLLSDGYDLNDFAVLFRTRAQTRVFEDALKRRYIPYKIIGLAGFYERKEIKDIISYMKLLANPADKLAFARAVTSPSRGIGPKTIEAVYAALDRAAATTASILDSAHKKDLSPKVIAFLELIDGLRKKVDQVPLGELIDEVIKDSGYLKYLSTMEANEGRARHENLQELKSITVEYAAQSGDTTLEGFLSRISLLSDADTADAEGGAVKLMTLHCAKGLEFRVVFISGMEEGLLPHHSAMEDIGELEEERRLCYVGITRAKELLYLTSAFQRLLFGYVRTPKPSRFLSEIAVNCVEEVTDQFRSSFFEQPAAAMRRSEECWREGDRVRHSIWGEGMVVSLKDTEICVAFPGLGIKRLDLKFAPLQRA